MKQKKRLNKRRQKSPHAMMVWSDINHPITGCRGFLRKKGPGVTARAKELFASWPAWKRIIAVDHGWFPAEWESMPVKVVPARVQNLRSEPQIINRGPGIPETFTAKPVAKPNKGIFSRIKNFFGIKK